MQAGIKQETPNKARKSKQSSIRRGQFVVASTLEERLCDTLSEYAEDVPEDAFPSFLESFYCEELSRRDRHGCR